MGTCVRKGGSINVNTNVACWIILVAWAPSAWASAHGDHAAINAVAERYGFAPAILAFEGQTEIQPAESVLLNKPFARKDKKGLKRDTQFFLAYQLAVIAALYVMPEDISGWSDEQKNQRRVKVWWDNVTNPQWDEDDLFINYALHPYWGATYFVRATERGFNNRESFYYSALLSTLYEFGAEAIFENPSIQDFFVTPIAGYYLGQYFLQVREDIRRRVAETGALTGRDKLVLALTDPLGSMNRYVDRKLGKDAQLDVSLQASTEPTRSHVGAHFDGHYSPGISLRLKLRY